LYKYVDVESGSCAGCLLSHARDWGLWRDQMQRGSICNQKGL